MTSDPAPQAQSGTAEGQPEGSTAPTQDAKARFKEALDRKNAAHGRSADGSRNTGAVHGSETKGPVQKMFRRKSG
ncbi:hypothetical protein ET495_06615 [Xylanimonas allomyrinae]|uniref:DUF5302 domain-containing protein n=1 Tax=Xylanimonas allomyrinae TaxID=2509459 RepID=A0A4P6EY32_9MICO|nr:DUF5302 domain-containing protein [Xylanimonas allomyrinae]QAY62968.1 hypothetical protein ET495_06615 [Xylanimonas allomyrinae]